MRLGAIAGLIRAELLRLDADVVALQEVLRPLPWYIAADELAADWPCLCPTVCFGKACQIDKPFPPSLANVALIRSPCVSSAFEAADAGRHRDPTALYILLSVKVGLLPVVITHLSEPELNRNPRRSASSHPAVSDRRWLRCRRAFRRMSRSAAAFAWGSKRPTIVPKSKS